MFNGVHHIAIICSNYEVSKRFYTETLGFTVRCETYRSERDSYKLDLCLNGDYVIELFSFPNRPARPSYPEACGLRHLAFSVDNVDVVKQKLESKGIVVENVRLDEITNKRFTFFEDPDHLPIEIYESDDTGNSFSKFQASLTQVSADVDQDLPELHKQLSEEYMKVVADRRISYGDTGSIVKKTEVVVKHIFGQQVDANIECRPIGMTQTAADAVGKVVTDRKKKSLSSLIEYPPDVDAIKKYLESPEEIDIAGRDYFGLSALDKFVSWNDVNLIKLMLEYLSNDQIIDNNNKEGNTCLHLAVELDCQLSYEYLLFHENLKQIQNKNQLTAVQLMQAKSKNWAI